MRLLSVEDHPFTRLGLRLAIRQPYPNCEIIEADNAEEGLFIALNEPVDLIVLDLCLPPTKGGQESFKQGLKILEALQILPHAPPIVVMSALTREAPAKRALQRGAAAIVKKGRPSGRIMGSHGSLPARQNFAAERKDQSSASSDNLIGHTG